MKRSIASLLAIFAAATAHAGSFGGPPPFTNGSPMVTGVDGSYQAVARSTNITGIIRFVYLGGSQTQSPAQNNWVFFNAGQVQRGQVIAAIDSSTVSGILDSVGQSTNTNSSITLPIVLLNANNAATGDFHGKMSANGDFYGSGGLVSSSGQTNQIVQIATNTTTGLITVTTTAYTNSAGGAPGAAFKFTGVRTSWGTASTN